MSYTYLYIYVYIYIYIYIYIYVWLWNVNDIYNISTYISLTLGLIGDISVYILLRDSTKSSQYFDAGSETAAAYKEALW